MSGDGTVSEATRQQAEDACSTMQVALAALKDSTDASCPVPTRQQVAAAVQLLRLEVAKMGLMYNQGGTAGGSTTGGSNGTTDAAAASPTEAEAESLLKGFQQATCTLCMVYTGLAVGPAAGPTLRTSLHQTATAVVEACVALVRGAVLGGAQDAQLMMLSGFCLEMLEAAEKAPLDSRTAIGRAITQVLKQLADAMKELAEEVEAAAETVAEEAEGTAEEAGAALGEEEEGAADADADSDAGFGMFQSEAFSAQQLGVARRVQGLLAAVVALVKAVVRLLLAEREGLSPEAVEGWESMLYHIKALAPVVDDLSAATYPPQDLTELSSAAECLATSCELLRDECPAAAGPDAAAESATAGANGEQDAQQQAGRAPPAEGGAGALQAALEAVFRAHAELTDEVAAADLASAEEDR